MISIKLTEKEAIAVSAALSTFSRNVELNESEGAIMSVIVKLRKGLMTDTKGE